MGNQLISFNNEIGGVLIIDKNKCANYTILIFTSYLTKYSIIVDGHEF